MAVALAAINNYFQNVLHITNLDVRNVLNDQGLQSFDNFGTLTEQDIIDICNKARKPGGTIANPAYVAPMAGVPALPGVTPTLPNPGVTIRHVVEKHLEMTRFLAYHCRHIQRTFNGAIGTLARLNNLYELHLQEEEYDNDIDLPDKLMSVDSIRTVIENLDQYLLRKRGINGIPLVACV